MHWTNDKSLTLSLVCVYVCTVLYVALCIGAPFLPQALQGLLVLRGKLQYLVWAVYELAPAVFITLWQLYHLLKNIRGGQVFVAQNVRALRIISWCCLAAAAIFFLNGCFVFSLFILGGMAGFIGLILRVVKNVFAQAVALKNENDLTI